MDSTGMKNRSKSVRLKLMGRLFNHKLIWLSETIISRKWLYKYNFWN